MIIDADALYVVAWAMWANADATYVGGVYRPDETELHLAHLFIESLAERGFEIRKIVKDPCVSGPDSGIKEVQGAERPPREETLMDAAVREAVAAAPKVSAEQGWVAAARQVMESGFVVFDGMVFDHFSASAMIQVHDALSAANQARFAAMPVQQAQSVAFKLAAKARG